MHNLLMKMVSDFSTVSTTSTMIGARNGFRRICPENLKNSQYPKVKQMFKKKNHLKLVNLTSLTSQCILQYLFSSRLAKSLNQVNAGIFFDAVCVKSLLNLQKKVLDDS